MIDDYSCYPEVDIVTSTSRISVIPNLDRIFAFHEIPQIVKSDNGAPFHSTQCKNFVEHLGFT